MAHFIVDNGLANVLGVIDVKPHKQVILIHVNRRDE
jgi:hypothetical protein